MATIQNIYKFLDFKGLSVNEFSKKVAVSNGYFAKQRGSEGAISSNILEKIAIAYPEINPEWLLTGRGSMLKTEAEQVKAELPAKTNPNALVESEHGIPLIPIKAMAGFGKGIFTDLPVERYNVPEFMSIKAEFMIRVSGDSMEPIYRHRDLVACQLVSLTDILFLWNRVYVLMTEEGAFIKYVRKSENAENVLLVSENKDYEPMEMPIKEIYSLAIVVGGIRVEE